MDHRDAAAVDGAFAGGGAEERGEEADGGALARAVGADEAEHLAGADLEVQVRDGDEFAVDLGEVVEFDHGEGEFGGQYCLELDGTSIFGLVFRGFDFLAGVGVFFGCW